MRRVTQFLGFAMLAACSNFEAAPGDAVGSDAAADGAAPVTGYAETSITVTLADPKLVLSRGATTKVGIVLDRNVAGEISVALENLPLGVAANPVTVPNSSSRAELEVTVAPEVAQGALKDASIVARLTSSSTRSRSPFNAFIRGRRGEIDTTFAVQGVLLLRSSTALGARLAVDEVGGGLFVLSNDALTRYSMDGARDDSFSVATPSSSTPQGVTVLDEHVYAFPFRRIERRTKDGTLDATFAGGRGYLDVSQTYLALSDGLLMRADGKFIAGTRNMYGTVWNLSFYNRDGSVDAAIGTQGVVTGNALQARWPHAEYVGDTVVFIGESGSSGADMLGRILLPTGALDARFNTVGSVSFPSKYLRTFVLDKDGYTTVIGLDSDVTTPFLRRVDARGVVDSLFTPAIPIAAYDTTLTDDGKGGYIVAVSPMADPRCTLFRLDRLGNIDKSFGVDGRAELATPGCTARTLRRLNDGRILVGDSHALQRVWD